VPFQYNIRHPIQMRYRACARKSPQRALPMKRAQLRTRMNRLGYALPDVKVVIAGLDTASRVYPTCGG